MRIFFVGVFFAMLGLPLFSSCREVNSESNLNGPPNDAENPDFAADALYDLIANHSQPASLSDLAPGSMDGFTCEVVNTAVGAKDSDLWNLRTAAKFGGLVYDARMQTTAEKKTFQFTFSKDPKKSLSTVALAAQSAISKDAKIAPTGGSDADQQVTSDPIPLTDQQTRNILMMLANTELEKNESVETSVSDITFDVGYAPRPLKFSGIARKIATYRAGSYQSDFFDPFNDTAENASDNGLTGVLSLSWTQPSTATKQYLCLYASKNSSSVEEVYFEFGDVGAPVLKPENMRAEIIIETKIGEEDRDKWESHGRDKEQGLARSVKEIKTVANISASRIADLLPGGLAGAANPSSSGSFCLSGNRARTPGVSGVMTHLGRCYIK